MERNSENKRHVEDDCQLSANLLLFRRFPIGAAQAGNELV